MSNSSYLGGDIAARQAEGRDADLLGPSDTSDSGSDIQGAIEIDAADEFGNIGQADHAGRSGFSDATGTGERGSALLGDDIRDGNDIMPDHIVGSYGEDVGEIAGELDGVDEIEGDEDDDVSDEDADDFDEVDASEDQVEPTSDPLS